MLTRIAVACAVAALACGAFATELFAQAGQVAPPVPLRVPSINSVTSQCQINCDMQAMNCQNACAIPIVNPLSPAGVTAPCNLSCTTSQLTCKQRC
jgi:hypothetical protein